MYAGVVHVRCVKKDTGDTTPLVVSEAPILYCKRIANRRNKKKGTYTCLRKGDKGLALRTHPVDAHLISIT